MPAFLTQLLSEQEVTLKCHFKMCCRSKSAKNQYSTRVERPSAAPASTTRQSVNRGKIIWLQATAAAAEEQVSIEGVRRVGRGGEE